MTLPSSGAISFSNVDTELGYSSTATVSLNDTAVRLLFGISSGAIDMNTGHGKSNTVIASYLVIAGGAGSSGDVSGGGGAGGALTGTATLNPGTAYTVVIGGGSAGVNGPGNLASNGSDSYISGSGLSTIYAYGGGYAACDGNVGGSGGCGGGGTEDGTYPGYNGAGTSGGTGSQGGNGGHGYGSGYDGCCGGGGGGAGSAGGDASSGNAGNGGDGIITTLITTSQATTYSVGQVVGAAIKYVFFGGGGGGGGYNISHFGYGGAGGGGAGQYNGGASGSANSGGGGGGNQGGTWSRTGGSGGSGCVIISASRSAASTTGSPVSTTNGANYVYIFTGSGSITF